MTEEANVEQVETAQMQLPIIPDSIESNTILADRANVNADGGSGSTELRTFESTSPSNSRTGSNNVPLPLPASSGIRKSQDSMHKNRASISKKAEQKAAVKRANQEESKATPNKQSFGGLEQRNSEVTDEMPMDAISMKNSMKLLSQSD